MTEPTYSRVTEDLYASLPAVQRQQDGLSSPEYVMKTWVSGIADQVGEAYELVKRIDYYPPDQATTPEEATSGLADADEADLAWLPWIGQLLGVQVDVGLSETAQRDQVRGAVNGFRAGTKSALAAAAASVLTGERYVRVDDHTDETGIFGAGSQWDVMLTTRASETGEVDVVAAVIEKGAKPAGVILHHQTITTTWDVLEAERPTWADWDGASWVDIEETGL